MQERILSFLLRAKKHTYAAHGAEGPSSRPASHDLQFAEGDLLYIDTYLGGLSFAGEEAVWDNGVPVWSMNYCGRVTGEGFSGDFLKRALLLVPEEMPFRGPELFEDGEMRYSCRVAGDVSWFQGYEEISKGNQTVYECYFHGGDVR